MFISLEFSESRQISLNSGLKELALRNLSQHKLNLKVVCVLLTGKRESCMNGRCGVEGEQSVILCSNETMEEIRLRWDWSCAVCLGDPTHVARVQRCEGKA